MFKKVQELLKENILFIVLLFGIFVFMSIFGSSVVSGTSMLPTLEDGDFLLLLNTDRVKNGDIIAIWDSQLNKYLCKRVIGQAGDTVRIEDGKLYVNNELKTETYLNETEWGRGLNQVIDIKDGQIFVMGDNRNHSLDSRELGVLNTSEIYGKMLVNITKHTGLDRKGVFKITCIIGLVLLIINILLDKVDNKTNSGFTINNKNTISKGDLEDEYSKD